MKLFEYTVDEATGPRKGSGLLRVTLSTWEALGCHPRPPVGLKRASDDTPVVYLSRTIGES